MNKNKTIWIVVATALYMILAVTAGAQVVDTNGTASVDVQPALSISLVTSPNWGKVVKPAAGTARYKLDYATGTVSLVSGDGYAFNDGQLGEYTVTGAPSAPISFSVAIGSFDASGVSVVASHINGTTDTGTGTLDIGGSYDLKVGGILDIVSTATVQVQTATVTVTIDYQ
ncbi:MAG TPA: hypothetical protein VHE55_03595 [Fimbriimonadaceae bacterium]|nr:hypothetical protein [Fimbriimonadaceae bacterium]